MYYLLSRYYYPKWRRFLTPDTYTYLELDNINDLNLFAYCNNNPVIYSDGDGHVAILSALLIGAGIGALFGGAFAGISGAISGDTGWDIVRDVFAGALTGAALGLSLSAGGLVGVGAISGLGTLGSFVGTTALSYASGLGAYFIKNAGKESFSEQDMFNYAGKVALNSMFNFAIGTFFGRIGAWDNIGDKAFSKFRNEIANNTNAFVDFAKAAGVYAKEFGLQIAGRSVVRSGVWWLINEL